VGLLVVLSLAMITISFREAPDGPLHEVQSIGATALRPFQVGAERVVRPFRDAWGWTAALFSAKGEVERLRLENQRLRQEAVQYRNAYAENMTLREVLDYKAPPAYPGDYSPVFAAVIAHPPSQFAQQVVIAAGEGDGVRVDDPVVNADGLVGRVTAVTPDTAQVTLLTDASTAVSAYDVETEASGLVQSGRTGSGALVLSRVEKRYEVRQGDEIVTSGSQRGQLPSLFPRGISVGEVTYVGRADTDLYLRIQIRPSVDFGALDAVVVLVPADRRR
jgi:rod shape-determining protein MreC